MHVRSDNASFSISLVLLFVIQLAYGGELIADLPEESTNPEPLSSSPAQISLRICNKEDNISNAFCQCNDKVVSCDFSKFTWNETRNTVNRNESDASSTNTSSVLGQVEMSLWGYQFPENASRFCLCNTPSNVHVIFSKKFLPQKNKFQRYDLYNLGGVTHLDGGFSNGGNFHGDLYIANVSYIPKIAGYEFTRGTDDPIISVQDIECCSPIKLNQSHERPVLLIENSTINSIETRGLNDDHLWKTMILKSNALNNLQIHAIVIDSYKGYNFALLASQLRNASNASFVIQDAANVIIAYNKFDYNDRVRYDFLQTWSSLKDSNLVLLRNKFWNRHVFGMDARRIISWYNDFDVWDNETFREMKFTIFSTLDNFPNASKEATDRSIDFKYNLVRNVDLPRAKILNFGNDSTVAIKDNVLSGCNCTWFSTAKDELLKPELNWCYQFMGKCSTRLDVAMKECSKDSNSSLDHLCENRQVSIRGFPSGSKDTGKETKAMRINSNFISNIIAEFHKIFANHHVAELNNVLDNQGEESGVLDDEHLNTTPESEIHSDSKNEGASHKTKSAAVPVIVTLALVAFIIVVGIFLYRNKHRLRMTLSGHQELTQSRSEMM